MDPERWRRIEALLDEALELDTAERPAFLRRVETTDPELLAEVQAILDAGTRDDSVLDASAAVVAAPILDAVDEWMPRPFPGRVGPYRIERAIGEGGMGTVFLAHRDDGQFAQRVALKLVRRDLHLDARILRRFRDERQILAALQYPGIARLLDGGLTDDGLPYFAMEYVEGLPIDRYCDERNIGVDDRLRLFVRVCDALAHAHDRQIVHRDIKPSNILVSADDTPHLLDFGIAKLLAPDPEVGGLRTATRQTERMLTPEYASPEQIRGEPVGIASDVYALGVLLYELLTGTRPFRRSERTPHELARAVLEEDPTRPSEIVEREPLRRRLKGDLDTIVLMAMRKEPERRYASAAAMADDVRRHLARRPVMARGAAPVYRVRRWVRRHRLALGVGLAAAIVAAAAATIAFRATTPRRLALADATRLPIDPELSLDAEISPDARRLAYVAGTGSAMKLYVRAFTSGRVIALGDGVPGFHRWPRWSPDGKRIAIMANARIYIVSLDGRSQVLVAPDGAATYVAFPAWSPDGRAIAYVQEDAIVVRDLATGKPRRFANIPRGPHSLRWSPDGKWLALVSGNLEYTVGTFPWSSVQNVGNAGQSSIWLLPVSGGAAVRVSDAIARALNVSPVWMPDSRALLYISNRDGARDVYRVAIDQNGAPTGPPQRITTGLLPHTISLSADGSTLGFSVFRLIANVWRATGGPNASEPVPVTRGAQSVEGVSLSRDGRMLAFDSDRNGSHDIYTVAATGGEPRRITTDPVDEFMPSWSPDGYSLAYHAFGRNGARQLRIVPADGGPPSAVSETPLNQRQPSWSPDGHALSFDAGRTALGDVFVTERTGRTWREPHLVATGGGTARWSPDGRGLLFVRPDGIWVTSPVGAAPRNVLTVAPNDSLRLGNAEWSHDGARIYFKRFDGDGRTSFWSIAAGGGAARLEVQLARDLRSDRAEFATDGTLFYFTVTERASELWTAAVRGVR